LVKTRNRGLARQINEQNPGWVLANFDDRSTTMPPQPKRKHSSGRRDRRRAHDALTPNNLVQCSNCGEMRLPHRVCPKCGHYQGREVIEIEKEKKK
jgi:large subunit ribosomal protein L32